MQSLDGDVDAMTVALLHDTVEDTWVTLDYLRYDFAERIINAVDAITKRKGERYIEYLKRVKANPLALRVKLADIAHNTSPKRMEVLKDGERKYLTEKYEQALAFLNGVKAKQ